MFNIAEESNYPNSFAMPARIDKLAVTQCANAQSDGDVNKFPLISRKVIPSDMFF